MRAKELPECEGKSISYAIAFLFLLAAWLVQAQGQPVFAFSNPARSFHLSSASFSGGVIPARYTCQGTGISPELHWEGVPAQAKSVALVMHDPDAPVDFTHWLVYNIPSETHNLPEGASLTASMPDRAAEGTNSFRRSGYGGPCPPPGKPHHYQFHLVALDRRLDLPSGAERFQVEAAMDRHVIAEAETVGTYQRAGN